MDLGNAIGIVAQNFANRKDKAGEPYILHCLRVMNNLHTRDKELQTIAILHDFVEDIFHDAPEKGLGSLRVAGYSERVIRAVDLLTHRKEVPYLDYIKALAHNPDAVKVKLADLKDNSDITRLKGLTKKDFDRMEKYHTAYTYLSSL